MTFRDFLNKNSVVGIDEDLSNVFDQIGEQLLRIHYGLVPKSVPGAAIPAIAIPKNVFAYQVFQAFIAKKGITQDKAQGLFSTDGKGLLNLIENDINLSIIPYLIAGATSLNIKPTPGPPVAIPAIQAISLATMPATDINAKKFAISSLEWAASFLFGDLRILNQPVVLRIA